MKMLISPLVTWQTVCYIASHKSGSCEAVLTQVLSHPFTTDNACCSSGPPGDTARSLHE